MRTIACRIGAESDTPAAALAFTASPALGQFRPEIPQWDEQENVSVQSRLGLMYDLDWNVPQNDAEDGSWKPILIAARIGSNAFHRFRHREWPKARSWSAKAINPAHLKSRPGLDNLI